MPEKKPIMVRRLTPPPEIQFVLIQKDKLRPHPNKWMRIILKFFGEGF